MPILLIAAAIAAIAFALLVGYLIPILIRVRRNIERIEHWLEEANAQLAPMVSEVRAMVLRINALVDRADARLERAGELAEALGEIGTTLQAANEFVKRRGSSFYINMASLAAGAWAAWKRLAQHGPSHHASHNGGGPIQ